MKPDHGGEGRWSVRHTGQCGYGIYDRRGDSSPIASGMTEERADEIAGLMARLDKATELLGKSINACTIARLEELKATIRAFLERKTDDKQS